MKKICSKCKEEKEISEFQKDISRKDGYCYICKACHNHSTKIYYINNPEKRKEYLKNNKEKIAIWHKLYFINNPEKRKEYHKNENNRLSKNEKKERLLKLQLWIVNNPEKAKEKRKNWVKNNPEKVKEYTKKYRNTHPEKKEEKRERDIMNLSDNYVALKNKMSVKEFRELPEEVQHIYRTSIKIHRVFKQQKEKQLL